ENYYRDIINKTNGLLIPGGGQDLLTSGYAKAGRLLWQLSTTVFKDRKYPIWGTCLGFELITQFYANNTLSDCDAIDVSNSLTFVEPIQDSRLLQDNSIVEVLKEQEVTYNYHKKCLTLETFNKTPELHNNLRLLSTNKDKNGIDYVSMFESRDANYPIYGVQWHPEKNLFEFAYNAKYQNIPHNSSAIKVSQYMSNFFVDECRKSVHPIVNAKEESDSLIYNYQPVYTGAKTNYTYEQIYLFNSHKPNHWSVSIGPLQTSFFEQFVTIVKTSIEEVLKSCSKNQLNNLLNRIVEYYSHPNPNIQVLADLQFLSHIVSNHLNERKNA
ncbi:unnamed protein product, partial [Oppiella nova]